MQEEKQVKKPRKPTEPYKPSLPDEPKETMTVFTSRDLGSIWQERFTIADFTINVRERLESAGLAMDTLLEVNPDQDYDGDFNGRYDLCAQVPKEVPNPHYKKQVAEYKLNEKRYAKEREKYQRDLAEYKTSLKRYHEDMKTWEAEQKELEMKRLEERLAKLRKETGKPEPGALAYDAFCQKWQERDSWSGPADGGWTIALTKEALQKHIAKEHEGRTGSTPEYYITTDGSMQALKIDEHTLKAIKKAKDGVVWLSSLPGKG
jgi:hypothetical protein